MKDYVWHVIMFKTRLLYSCCSSTWLVMVQCCLGHSIAGIELMVKIGRGETRVSVLEHCWPFRPMLLRFLYGSLLLIAGKFTN
jgi:hypothetical protein